jgi:hypothetical protein
MLTPLFIHSNPQLVSLSINVYDGSINSGVVVPCVNINYSCKNLI